MHYNELQIFSYNEPQDNERVVKLAMECSLNGELFCLSYLGPEI
jgi:hypothetical protein